MKRVNEIMSTDVLTISPDTSLTEAAMQMARGNVGFLPVVEANRIVGTVTDRDMVVRFAAKGGNMDNTKVRDVMTEDAACLEETASVQEADRLMSEERIRRIPVVGIDKALVGVVSLDDMALKVRASSVVHDAARNVSRPS